MAPKTETQQDSGGALPIGGASNPLPDPNTGTSSTPAPAPAAKKKDVMTAVDADVDSPMISRKGDPVTLNPGYVDDKGRPAGWKAPPAAARQDVQLKAGGYTTALTCDLVTASGQVKTYLKGDKVERGEITDHDALIYVRLGYLKQ